MPKTKEGVFYMDAYEVAQMKPPHKNIAIAMVAACIVHHWKRGLNLKSITLNKHFYELYRDFVRVVYGEEAADKRFFSWHDIEINQGLILTGEPMSFEIEKPKAQA